MSTKGVRIEYDMWGKTKGGLNEMTIQPWMDEKTFVWVKSIDEIKTIADNAIKAGKCVVDIESQGLDTRIYNGRPIHGIVGFVLCYDGETGYYAPVRHTSNSKNLDDPQNGNLNWDLVKEQIQRVLSNCICIYHNAPYDTEIMYAEGFVISEDPDTFEDTQLEGWLIDSNKKRIGLKEMSKDHLGWRQIEFKELFPEESKKLHLENIHPEEVYVYASSDGICTFNLHEKFRVNEILKSQAFIYKVEKMLVPVLRRMVRNKFKIDVEYLKGLDKEIEQECIRLMEEIKALCQEPDLNVDSPKQLGEILFNRLKIPNKGLTKSENQFKTDEKSLEELNEENEGKYPALSKVVHYRKLQKLRSTYVLNLINNVDDNHEGKFGIMAPGAPTGRFAAPGGDPDQGYTGVNSQAIPKVKESTHNVRKAFVARDGYIITCIDYSGQELRVAGNEAEENKWIREFNHLDCVEKFQNDYEVINPSPLWQHCPYCHKKMGDVHSQTSIDIFGDAEEDHRNKSKGVNFGVLYGAEEKTIARNVKVSEDEGYRIVKRFFSSLPAINRWVQRQHATAKEKGFVKTAFNRIRLIPEMKSEEKGIVKFGERTSVNSVVQGCLHPDCSVYTSKGKRTLQELYQNQTHGQEFFRIWTGRSWENAKILVSGLKDLVITKFDDGNSIRTSPEHLFRVWTPKGLEWIPQSKLDRDMWVASNSTFLNSINEIPAVSDYLYLRVSDKKITNEKVEMLDVEVFDKDHAFVCEDFIVHNTSADITKIAMIMCDKEIQKRGWQDVCRILLTVHDEIVFEILESMKDEIIPVLGKIMCKCAPSKWKIKLTVDMEHGPNWGEAKKKWLPKPPVLRAKRPGLKKLWPEDLDYEQAENSDDQIEITDEKSIPETTEDESEAPKQEKESEEENVQNEVKEKILKYILKKPYTKNKLRKLEALFILAGDGDVILHLLSESGEVLNFSREIRIDPVYFQYKAMEWGL
jgi:DNA polymerase I-like protein with 3'-5' exonuclease and polymerase domains